MSTCCVENPCSDHNRNKRLKSNVPTPKDDDEVIARLNSLSLAERSEGLNDVHGVADIPDENPEMLEAKLQEMNEILSSSYLPLAGDDSAYRKAMAMDPEYVDQYKLPFLRALLYNSRKAVPRLLLHFEQKAALFGEDKLVKDIQLDDLSEKDREALY